MANISTYVGGAGGLAGGECITCAGGVYCMTSDNQSAVAICFNQSACLYLPNATTIDTGAAKYTIKNINNNFNITVYDYDQNPLNVLTPCQSLQVSLYDNATTAGKWIHEKPTTNLTGVGIAQSVDVVTGDFDYACTSVIDEFNTIAAVYSCDSCLFKSTLGTFDPVNQTYTWSNLACFTTCTTGSFINVSKLNGACADDSFALVFANQTGPQIVVNSSGGICACCLTTSCTLKWNTCGWGLQNDGIDRIEIMNPICGVTTLCYERNLARVDLSTGAMCFYENNVICDCVLNDINRYALECRIFATKACHFLGTVVCRINYSWAVPYIRCYENTSQSAWYCGQVSNPILTVRVPTYNANTNDYCACTTAQSLGFNTCYIYTPFNDLGGSTCVRKERPLTINFPGTACCFHFYSVANNYDSGAGQNFYWFRTLLVCGASASATLCALCCAQASCLYCNASAWWPVAEGFAFVNASAVTDITMCLSCVNYGSGSVTPYECFSLRCDGQCGPGARRSLYECGASLPCVVGCFNTARICNTKYHDPNNIIMPMQYQPPGAHGRAGAVNYGMNSYFDKTGVNCGWLVLPHDACSALNQTYYKRWFFNGTSVSSGHFCTGCLWGDPFCTSFFRDRGNGSFEFLDVAYGASGIVCACNCSMSCINSTLQGMTSVDCLKPIDCDYKYHYINACCRIIHTCRDISCNLLPCCIEYGNCTAPQAATGVNVNGTNCITQYVAPSVCGAIISYQNACTAFTPTVSVSTMNCTTLKFENKNCFNLDTIPIAQTMLNKSAQNGGYAATQTTTCTRSFQFLSINP